ncbi:hypothetical protein XENOCAPTIV_003155 [Xenoophorus captivus]|uniref:BRCT domain-containing protein n=1 Tax=Xenoophorus captivus TaxID=1517983 RepID=A0ABV0R313_9TELE
MSKAQKEDFIVKFVESKGSKPEYAVKAYELGCRIVSPLVVLYCLQHQHCAEVMDLVQLMGGRVYLDLNVSVTHLIAGEVGSKKYLVAASLGKPILLPTYTELPIEDYLCPVLLGCTVCVTGLSSTERKEVQRLCEQHGAKYTGQLKMNECTHLIVNEPTGQKYECAKKWNVFCVSLHWLFDSIEKGFCQDESRPHVVTAQWLLDCFSKGRMLPEDGYLHPDCLPPASAAVSVPAHHPARPRSSVGPPVANPSTPREPITDEDLLSQYMDDDPTVEPQPESWTPHHSRGPEQDSLLQDGLFSGRSFLLVGFGSEAEAQLSMLVKEQGGKVLMGRSRVVADFAVVPQLGCTVEATVDEVVTDTWLVGTQIVLFLSCRTKNIPQSYIYGFMYLLQAMCVEKEGVLPLSSNPLFTPVPVREGYLPLKDCVLSVSQFTGAERESLVELAKHLGAKYVF